MRKPSLDYETTLAAIKSGKIATRQIGNAPLWVVTGSFSRLGIRKGTILFPNVTAAHFIRSSELYSLLSQHGHIMDGYGQGEIPKLAQIFETLVKIGQVLGFQGRLSPEVRKRVISELSYALIKMRGTTGGKGEARQMMYQAVADCIHGLSTGRISGKVEQAIGFITGRLEQIGTKIAPLIDRRRIAALYEIAQQERNLWRIAYTLRTRRRTLSQRNITDALKRDLDELALSDVLPFRRQVITGRTLVNSALAALKANNPNYAGYLLDRAINHLGFVSENLRPIPRQPKGGENESREQ